MKQKIIALLLCLIAFSGAVKAQSSMSDDQILQFVIKEHSAGTSQAQIVTKLMQKGVNIQQIRRVRSKYERQMKNGDLGFLSTGKKDGDDNNAGRNRRNNSDRQDGKDDRDSYSSDTRLVDGTIRTKPSTYDEDDPDWLEMQDEMNSWMPDTATMFKQLMDEKYGKKKVFGRDIFNNKKLSFEPNMNIATPTTYRLGPGDAVYIDIYGASQKTIEATISPEGEVTIDGFGPVALSGLTVEQANEKLRNTLGKRYQSSSIKLTVGQTRTIIINVMGEVKTPGTYTVSAFASVFHALYMAGGINDLGTLRNIKVYRQGKLVTVVDIYDYIFNGRLNGNIRLTDNDVIVVGAYDAIVGISGKVKRPMLYEMKKGESLQTLLKYSGGFTGDAYTSSVRVIRKTGREYSIHTVNEFDLPTFTMNDADSVSVDSVLPRFSNMAEIKGAVYRPGMYEVGSNICTVRDLLDAAEGLREEAFTAHAVMHRQKTDRTLEVLSVDVEGILAGRVADIPLRKNDVLFIPTRSEMMEEQTITIHGEVHYPGVYKYADNETLEDFVLQAGGLKQTASTVKVDIARRVSNPKALANDSIIARTYSFALKDGFVIDGEPGFKLMPFDEVYVRKSPGFYEQQNVVVDGEVMFSGTYTLSRSNTRLSDVIQAAGGPSNRAYIKGARLERHMTQSERLRMESLLKSARQQSGDRDSVDIKKLDLGDTYYVGIELDKALSNPGCDEDVVLREGDRIIVPQYTNTVRISGDVMYPTTVSYEKGKGIRYYINEAGGFGNRAKKSNTYIIYMNGKVAKAGHGVKPQPGCEIVVPTKPKRDPSAINQWLGIGTSVASIATMFATITNLIK